MPKFAEDAALIPADTITIDLQPLAAGCELNLTHRRTVSAAAETADQATERWTGMLDLLSEILREPPPTCGVGLAQHATVPTRIGLLFRALAETLELHRGTLMLNDPNARAEDYAYQHLASSYRQLAMLVQGTASKMAEYRELPAAAHDPRAFGPDHVKAFARYVKAQSRLLSILKGAAERDEELLEQMSAPPRLVRLESCPMTFSWGLLLGVAQVIWVAGIAGFIMQERRSPAATLAWITMVASLPAGGRGHLSAGGTAPVAAEEAASEAGAPSGQHPAAGVEAGAR